MNPEPLESTAVLLRRYVEGDERAADRLLLRYIPRLRVIAHGRLPHHARGMMDTDDLVQETLVRALGRVRSFEHRHEGAFLCFVRTILTNRLHDEARKGAHRPGSVELDDGHHVTRLTPLEEAIGREDAARLEAAIASLPARHREAYHLRVELGYSYAEMAEALGPGTTANAARLLASRAIRKLAEILSVER